MLISLTSLSLALFLTPVTGISAFEDKCLAFEPENFVPGATRTVLEYVSAGTTLLFPDNAASCNRGAQAVTANVCRIALSIETSSQSNITFEAWLPENWSGRFLATGNGGIDGCMCTSWQFTTNLTDGLTSVGIKYEDLAYTSANEFAAVGSNNGKNGTDGLPFFKNSETVIDFAWRS